MATHLGNPNNGDNKSSGKEGAGPSYASAVLKFKTTDSNKENIHDSSPPSAVVSDSEGAWETQTKGKSRDASKSSATKQTGSRSDSHLNIGEDFPSISSSGPSKPKPKDNHNAGHKDKPGSQPISGATDAGKPVNHRNREKETPKEPAKPVDTGKKPAEVVKFVEAPIPKVNPWAIKNAASVIKGKEAPPPPVPEKPIPPPVAVTEKRVLQPHTTGTSIFPLVMLVPTFLNSKIWPNV